MHNNAGMNLMINILRKSLDTKFNGYLCSVDARLLLIVSKTQLGLYRISAPALANPECSHFLEIWPTPAPAKFLSGFVGFVVCQCSCSAFS